MPALVAFGRRWQVGTDDFVLPGILDSTVKTCWLVAAIIIFLQNDSHALCENGYYMKIYFYIMIIALTLTILTDLSIVRKSMSGYMMDNESRRLVVPLIYVRLFWEILDIGWNIVGTIWAYGETLSCVEMEAPRELKFIKRFIICNWMSVVFLCLFLTYLFDPLGRQHLSVPKTPQGEEYTLHEPPETQRSLYCEKRCKIYCCFCCDEASPDVTMKRDGFNEVGKLLGNLVQDYDLLPSDVLAGLMALYHRSEQIENRRRKQLGDSNNWRNPLNGKLHIATLESVITSQPKFGAQAARRPSLESKDKIVLLNHYMKFINGINGWAGLLADRKKRSKTSLRRFWKRITCCSTCLDRQGHTDLQIVGDNCCYCATAALKETTVSEHIREEDLIHISFENDYYRIPFYLALDHHTKSYVITLRGTFSGKDIITDLTAWPVPTDIPGLPDTYLVHHGMLLTARNIKTRLESLGLLANMQSAYPDYKLVLIGQSLGAAVASILGMLLRSEFPNLSVFAFSPPGGLMNLETSIYSESFITSVVYGTDIVARLSLIALNKFRSRIIEAIADCRTPKYKLLMGYCSCIFGEPKIKFQSLEENPIGRPTESCLQIDELRTKGSRSQVALIDMYLPGKILHVTERDIQSEDEEEYKTEPKYELRWAKREEFLEIIPSPRMYNDHWPFRMLKAFREALSQNHSGTNQEPESKEVVSNDLNGNDNKGFEL